MTTLDSILNTGLRGFFYTLKKICSTLFLLCCGFLLCLFLDFAFAANPPTTEERNNFIIVFIFVVIATALLWLLFRALHNSWVRRHMKQIKIDFINQLAKEGVIGPTSQAEALKRLS